MVEVLIESADHCQICPQFILLSHVKRTWRHRFSFRTGIPSVDQLHHGRTSRINVCNFKEIFRALCKSSISWKINLGDLLQGSNTFKSDPVNTATSKANWIELRDIYSQSSIEEEFYIVVSNACQQIASRNTKTFFKNQLTKHTYSQECFWIENCVTLQLREKCWTKSTDM